MIQKIILINILYICIMYCKENDTEIGDIFNGTRKLENVTQNLALNQSDLSKNKSLETERIIKPIAVQAQSQTQRINNVLNTIIQKNTKNKNEFKPSPQLEIEYEYNKFPVVPAFPEAKHFSSSNLRNDGFTYSSFEKQSKLKEPPWVSRVRFPTQGGAIQHTGEHPYPFFNGNADQVTSHKTRQNTEDNVKETARPLNSDNSYRETNYKQGFNFLSDLVNWNKPKEDVHKEKPETLTPLKHIDSSSVYGETNSDLSLKNSFLGTSGIDGGGPWEKYTPIIYKEKPKTKPNLSILDKPISPIAHSPWKKIIKFLTAFIPIGLLISALTPSVITIEDTNVTTSRARAEDNIESKRILQSLTGIQFSSENICEERVLCELLINSGSSNKAEQYVENLLETFINKNGHATEHVNELKRVLNAVRNENCALLECKKAIKGNT